MTVQSSNLCLQRRGQNLEWHFVFDDRGSGRLDHAMAGPYQFGGGVLHVVDSAWRELVRWPLHSIVPDFDKHASWSTAGLMWMDHVLAFCVGERAILRPWWGPMVVIDLENLEVVPASDLGHHLVADVESFVMKGLEKLVENPASRYFEGTISGPSAFPHHAGLLKMSQATDLLLKLEEGASHSTSSTSSGTFSYSTRTLRRTAQTALRRIGGSSSLPAGFPLIEMRLPKNLAAPATNNVNGARLHRLVSDGETLRRGMTIREFHRLFGPPHFVERTNRDYVNDSTGQRHYWRYDVDHEPQPYTLLVWWSLESSDKVVDRVVRYSPPWWTIGEDARPLFANSNNEEIPVLNSDTNSIWAFTKALEDGSFQGEQTELDIADDDHDGNGNRREGVNLSENDGDTCSPDSSLAKTSTKTTAQKTKEGVLLAEPNDAFGDDW